MRRFLVLLVVLTVCSPTVDAVRYDDASSARVFELTNQARVARGLPPLVASSELVGYARAHSAQMAQRHDIFHSSLPDGIYAENVGQVVADANWPAKLQRAFMNSPEHRENILEPRLKTLAVATVISDGIAYITEEYGLGEASKSAPKPSHTCSPIVRTDCSYRLVP